MNKITRPAALGDRPTTLFAKRLWHSTGVILLSPQHQSTISNVEWQTADDRHDESVRAVNRSFLCYCKPTLRSLCDTCIQSGKIFDMDSRCGRTSMKGWAIPTMTQKTRVLRYCRTVLRSHLFDLILKSLTGDSFRYSAKSLSQVCILL